MAGWNDGADPRPGCTANMTAKILGDDSLLMMDHFEEFLTRKVRIHEGICVFNTALLVSIWILIRTRAG